jgi:hypothetical protein
MSKRPKVFLSGAPFWYPLLGSASLLMGLESISFMGTLPFALQCISGLVLVANLGMLMSCRNVFGRWLGRTKYPEIGAMLSGIVFIINSLGFSFSVTEHIPPSTLDLAQWMLTISFICSLTMLIIPILTLSASFYYIEDKEGDVRKREFHPPMSDHNYVWKDLVQKKHIRVGDKLMLRKLFGSSVIREAKGMEWQAWHVDDVGKANKAITVFGEDIVSARRSASYIMMTDSDLIVVAPREINAACITEVSETAKRVQMLNQAAREEEEWRTQQKKAEVASLQNQLSPQILPILIEDHTSRMDRLFAQAIGTPYIPVVVDKN